MANGNGRLLVFATTASTNLAAKVCKRLSIEPGRIKVAAFNDGEPGDIQIKENVRGEDVYIIGSTGPNARFEAEMRLIAQAAWLSSAGRVTMVIPYLAYARGDRKDQPRKPINIKSHLKSLETSRPDRMILLDVHAEQSLACLDLAVHDHLYGSAVLVPHVLEKLKEHGGDFVVAAPDSGGVARADKYARLMSPEADLVYLSKRRSAPGKVDTSFIRIVGEVKGKIVIIVDDMIDSGGTVIAEAEVLKAAGALEVWVLATHGLFSQNAAKRIEESKLDRVYVTDSVFHSKAELKKITKKIKVVTSAGLLAKAIHRTHEGQSLSELIP